MITIKAARHPTRLASNLTNNHTQAFRLVLWVRDNPRKPISEVTLSVCKVHLILRVITHPLEVIPYPLEVITRRHLEVTRRHHHPCHLGMRRLLTLQDTCKVAFRVTHNPLIRIHGPMFLSVRQQIGCLILSGLGDVGPHKQFP